MYRQHIYHTLTYKLLIGGGVVAMHGRMKQSWCINGPYTFKLHTAHCSFFVSINFYMTSCQTWILITSAVSISILLRLSVVSILGVEKEPDGVLLQAICDWLKKLISVKQQTFQCSHNLRPCRSIFVFYLRMLFCFFLACS